jgi:hypothetical protein
MGATFSGRPSAAGQRYVFRVAVTSAYYARPDDEFIPDVERLRAMDHHHSVKTGNGGHAA